MSPKQIVLALGGYALFVAAVFLLVGTRLDLQHARQEAASAATARALWEQRYDSAAARVDTHLVKVPRLVPKWDTIYRDTGKRITDTAWVKEALAVADTTIRACTELVTSCSLFRVTADSTLAATRREATAYKNLYNATQRRRKLERCGVSVGYGAAITGGVIRTGPTVNAGCRIWP